ncbi:hypothetical protein GWE18_39100 [Bradyrhizobium sp. CSA112]|uniref:hypothetical protein n=1 Tax=Bradyrhizobium sp. CSA112 TaxID=2699170 RepID=UPI0023AEC504|nr:hypothetical protein [Bradyrhizobium sp. CSA112]MDE5458672.1 hypothetical protein [Bradyrhizobium sp. CSA112]
MLGDIGHFLMGVVNDLVRGAAPTVCIGAGDRRADKATEIIVVVIGAALTEPAAAKVEHGLIKRAVALEPAW